MAMNKSEEDQRSSAMSFFSATIQANQGVVNKRRKRAKYSRGGCLQCKKMKVKVSGKNI